MSLLPTAAVVFQEFISLFRTPRSGFIVRKRRQWRVGPPFLNRCYYGPSGFNLIGALEQSRVAHHAIVQEPLVSGAGHVAKIVFVIEIHIDGADVQDWP